MANYMNPKLLTASVLALGAALMVGASLMPVIAVEKSQPVKQVVPAYTQTQHRTVTVDGLEIFYREAGPVNAPTILLLHGFPTSSHMFRDCTRLSGFWQQCPAGYR